ncbi:hypothetical protein DYBT9623_00679 [Dyadobacter sp. CECT 9623]|uniref:Phage protein n=1 Tax=Dyadobacter linearis TaxID=2823330 RepID=A0ABN7R1C1_9BACT|nr:MULTISPECIES: hypothetical protein [Dyadobacter]CAG5067951.1 hypothetical protein DYBT9623_00679 [Dyadobacter sp. CECT 9623]
MKNFTTIKEAFDWWIKNKYPSLPPDVKKGKAVTAWRDYTHNRGISESRMKDILLEFGNFEIELKIQYKGQ